MRKRILAILLTLSLILVYVPQIAFAEDDAVVSTDGLTLVSSLTAVSGTSGVSTKEDYGYLLDGDITTKWCSQKQDSYYIEFYSNDLITPKAYALTTGNDTASYPERNPKDWTIKAKAAESDEWTVIAAVTDDAVLGAENRTTYLFSFDNAENNKYKYFRFEITALQSGSTFQLSELGIYKTEADATADLSNFATKRDLMTSLALDGTGMAGKLIFGKNADGESLEWYILGKDDAVTDDNTVILAASALTKSQFEDDYATIKTDSSLWKDCTYPSGTTITEVLPNHYGASDIRATLKELAQDTDYFSEVEQALMNATVITNTDVQNSVDYTTEDVLYLPAYNYSKDELHAGSSDDKLIPLGYRSGYGVSYYSRTPTVKQGIYAIDTAGTYKAAYTSNNYYVVPASNLNLTAVLFASSAPVSAGTSGANIADNTAMTLRFDGSDHVKLSGSSVAYNSKRIDYSASSGTTLMIQGCGSIDGVETNWYYSMPIYVNVTNAVLSAESIATELGLSYTPNLRNCKIWLETSEDGVVYAVLGNEEDKININTVEIDIKPPMGEQPFASTATCETTGVKEVLSIKWTDTDGNEVSGNAHYYPWMYDVYITLAPEDDYEFSENTQAIWKNTSSGETTLNTYGTLTVKFSSYSNQVKLLGITAPEAITGVASGTELNPFYMDFPKTVTITTEAASINTAEVTWDVDNLVDGSYDPSVLAEQTFTVKGTVNLPEEVSNSDGISLEVTIDVMVNASDMFNYTLVDTSNNHTQVIHDTLTLSADVQKDGVSTDKEITYQWYKGKTAIDGATDSTYTVPASDAAAVGTNTYKVVATYENYSEELEIEVEVIGPSYTVTIPATATAGETLTVSADAKVLRSVDELTVKITATSGTDNAFTLENEQGVELGYTFKNGETVIGLNDEIITVASGEKQEVTLSIVPEAAKYSGKYTGTVTFTIAVEEVASE